MTSNETWLGVSVSVDACVANVTHDNVEIRDWGSESPERSTESFVGETSGNVVQKTGL
jgi:hypothetical protein